MLVDALSVLILSSLLPTASAGLHNGKRRADSHAELAARQVEAAETRDLYERALAKARDAASPAGIARRQASTCSSSASGSSPSAAGTAAGAVVSQVTTGAFLNTSNYTSPWKLDLEAVSGACFSHRGPARTLCGDAASTQAHSTPLPSVRQLVLRFMDGLCVRRSDARPGGLRFHV